MLGDSEDVNVDASSMPVARSDHQQRLHPRYQLPALVKMGSSGYPVKDWSVAGFAIESMQYVVPPGRVVQIQLLLPFESLSVALNLEAESIWRDERTDTIGFRFTKVTPTQQQSLRQLADSVVAGEVVAVGDLIGVIGQGDAPARQQPVIEKVLQERRPSRRWMQLLGFSAFAIALGVLLSFVVSTLFQRAYVKSASTAVVATDLVRVRSPHASYFQPAKLREGAAASPGRVLASLRLVDGGTAVIESPCNCRILTSEVLRGQFVAEGEVVFTMTPEGARPYVRAQFVDNDLLGVLPGDPARIQLADGSSFAGVVAKPTASRGDARRYGNEPGWLAIETTTSLPVGAVHLAASVQVNTSRRAWWRRWLRQGS